MAYTPEEIRTAGAVQLRVIGREMAKAGEIDLDVLETWGGNRAAPSSFISSASSATIRAICLGQKPAPGGMPPSGGSVAPAAVSDDDEGDDSGDDEADDGELPEPSDDDDDGDGSFPGLDDDGDDVAPMGDDDEADTDGDGDGDGADDEGEPEPAPAPAPAPKPSTPAPAPAPTPSPAPPAPAIDFSGLDTLGIVGESIKKGLEPLAHSVTRINGLMRVLSDRIATVEDLANKTGLDVHNILGAGRLIEDRLHILESAPAPAAALAPAPSFDPEALTETLLKALRSMVPPMAAKPSAPAAPPEGADGFAQALAMLADPKTPRGLRILAKFAPPGAACRPVKFTGEPGAAKTWAARRFSSLFAPTAVFDVSCHAGTTSREFLGACLPGARGGFEPVYGRVTRAFRSASQGVPTLLILDEMNRLPLELSSVFCGALNRQVRAVALPGHEEKRMECYVLDSGIPDGFGGTEEYVAPCHLLSVVSTQNEGPGYNVNAEDRAEKQRWLHVRASFDADEMRGIITAVLAGQFPTEPSSRIKSGAERLVQFLVHGRAAALVDRKLESAPTLRVVVEAVALSSTPLDIAVNLRELSLGWFCGLSRINGAVEPEHVRKLDEILKACDFDASGRSW